MEAVNQGDFEAPIPHVFHVDVTELRDLGDRVLAMGKFRVRAREGGAETVVLTASIWTFRDGLLVHFKDYGDPAAALAAAGLA